MRRPTKQHRFKCIRKGGRKGSRGQTKRVRVGSRTPGSSLKVGSIRHPY